MRQLAIIFVVCITVAYAIVSVNAQTDRRYPPPTHEQHLVIQEYRNQLFNLYEAIIMGHNIHDATIQMSNALERIALPYRTEYAKRSVEQISRWKRSVTSPQDVRNEIFLDDLIA